MDYINNALPDNNKTVDLQLCILDPLSVIIKLAILSNKPIGTKICINKNIIHLQEPGYIQSVSRYVFKSNKTDLQYLYNPIELACQAYLTKQSTQQNPKIKELFKCSQTGILNLIETYKICSVMRICLNYFYSLIANYLDEKFNETLFRRDNMTPFYNAEILAKLNKMWSQDKIKIVLNITTYLLTNDNAGADVKSLETIMENIDKQTQLTI
jgi:hypothetical protein